MKIPNMIYGTAWKKENTTDLVFEALKQGFIGIDTACQPKHYREDLVGLGLQKAYEIGIKREDLFLQTKFTPIDGQDQSNMPYLANDEIEIQVEKSFEKMSAEKGIAEAFYFFADDSAVIKRENDTLIIGKENIKSYYSNPAYKNALVNWTPDFIDVSVNGNMAYTYGKYLWKIWNDTGNTTEYRGVFHTVWKKQKDNSWKYVWD